MARRQQVKGPGGGWESRRSALRSPDPDIWWAASTDIGAAARRSPKAQRFLIALSQHPQPRLRERAAPGLAAVCDRERAAAERLTALAQDHNASVRRRAGEAVGALAGSGDAREAAVERMVTEGDPEVRAGVASGLGRALAAGDGDAAAALARLLADDRDSAVRTAAASALGSATGAEASAAVAALLEVLPEADASVTLAAAHALAHLSAAAPRSALAGLRRLAESDDTVARGSAAVAIGEARGERTLLAGLAADRSPVVRAQAARSLGRRAAGGDSWAAPLLRRLVGDRDRSVRSAAAEAAGSAALWEIAADLSAHPDDAVRAGVAAGLADGDLDSSRAAPMLAALAADGASAVRAAAASGLGRLAGDAFPDARAALQQALDDSDPQIRQSAVLGIGRREAIPAEILERLISLADDPELAVRGATVSALGRAAGDSPAACLPTLLRLAGDAWLRESAIEPIARALSAMGPRALRHLDALIGSPADGQWLAAVGAAVGEESLGEFISALGAGLAGPDLLEWMPAAADWAQRLGADGKALAGRLSGASAMATATDTASIASFAGPPGEPDAALCPELTEVASLVARAEQAKGGEERAAHLARAHEALSALPPASDRNAAESRLLETIVVTWRTVIAAAEAVLRSRADVRVHVPEAVAVTGPTVTLGLRLDNVGLTAAHDVALQTDDSASPPVQIASLAPGQWAEVDLAISPGRGDRRLERRAVLRYRDESGERTIRLPLRVALTRPRRAFRPMPNPFAPGKPLPIDSPMFYGREDVFDFLRQNLKGAYHENIVALVGQRRSGKTSILKRIPAALGDQYVPVFLDAQGMLADSVPAFFHEIARRAAEALGQEASALPSIEDFRREPGRLADPGLLQALGRLAGDRRLLILLDEYDDLEAKVRSGLLPVGLFDGLRHLMQHSPQVAFVLSGTHRLEDLGAEYWSFLFNLALYHRIGPLDPASARALVGESFDRIGLLADDLVIDRLLSLCGRWPYFLQLAGHHLVLRCNRLGRGALTAADLRESLEGLSEWGEAHLRYLWDLAAADERSLLRALARCTGPASVEEIAATAGLPRDEVAPSLERMTAKLLLTVVGERSPRYWFQAGLLRAWIAHGGPVER